MRHGRCVGWLPAALLLFSAGTASATALSVIQAEITANGSYVEANGDLTFTFTGVTETTGNLDLGQIDLMLVDTGFDLTPLSAGAFSVSGTLADLNLEFTVESTLGISGASNEIEATVVGGSGVASVSELIVEFPGADLGVSDLEPFASADFGEVAGQLTIDSKNIVLSADTGATVDVTILRQRFAVVPEPGTAGLLLLGLAALGRGRSTC
jgi:hypothetical protein